MNLFTFETLQISTRGLNESKFIDLPNWGFSSKLGSLEMQAKWITASWPGITFDRSLTYNQDRFHDLPNEPLELFLFLKVCFCWLK